jgi:hypothetical protein
MIIKYTFFKKKMKHNTKAIQKDKTFLQLQGLQKKTITHLNNYEKDGIRQKRQQE